MCLTHTVALALAVGYTVGMTANQVLEISRTSHGETRVVDDELGELAEGSVRLKVDRFSITANTVTYANAGDMLGYWDFYPSGTEGWGRTPAMGWGEVAESNHPDVEVGGRYYGWYPMAQFVDMTVSVTPTGLRDDGDHRAAHAPVYRTLEAPAADPLFPDSLAADAVGDVEDRHALVRGLFMTGYLSAAFFQSHDWYGTPTAVLLSASSKTAIGFADAAQRLGASRVVGVTSPGNVDFVSSIDAYDSVITYDQAQAGDHDITSGVIVDMAGNRPVLAALHEKLGDSIGYSMMIGMTHHDVPQVEVSSGPSPQLFFAPTAMSEMSQAGTDTAALQADAASSLAAFVEASHEWLEVDRVAGAEAAAETWEAVHGGTLPPNIGRIVSMHS